MARKRLLMILAGVVAVIGLQAGPATALEAEADLLTATGVSLSEDGIEAEVGDEDEGAKAKVSEDGVEAEVGDREVSTEDPPDPDEVEEELEEETEDADADVPDEPTADDDDEASSDRPSRSRNSGTVTTAGSSESVEAKRDRPDPLDPEQARRFLPSSEGADLSGRDDVTPSFDLSDFDSDFDDPIVAAPPEQGEGSGDWESVSPQQERSDAELAAIPVDGPDGGAVPAGLKLLAGLLVAGTATVWHLTRRELGTVPTPIA